MNTLNPISIATYGAWCGDGPDDIAMATLGLVCSAVREAGGGSAPGGPAPASPGARIYRIPIAGVDDDEEAVTLAITAALVTLAVLR